MLKKNAVYGLVSAAALAALVGCSEDSPVAVDRTLTAPPLAGFAAPATVYVDAANTSGVEDGSAVNPYNTVAEGIAAVPSGGTVEVRTGTYEEAGLIVSKNITIRGPADKSARIASATATFIFEVRDAIVTFRNLWVGDLDPNYSGIGIGSGNASTSADITIDRCSLVGLGVGASVNDWGYHQGNLTITDSRIHDCITAVQENDAGTILIEGTTVDECVVVLAGIGQVGAFSVWNSEFRCNVGIVKDTDPDNPPVFSPSIVATKVVGCGATGGGLKKRWFN